MIKMSLSLILSVYESISKTGRQIFFFFFKPPPRTIVTAVESPMGSNGKNR